MGRDPNRLCEFYEKMWFMHMQVPDLRFGQVMECFFEYCKTQESLPGDYIIKGIHGEFYACKPDVFAETYEEVK